VSVSIENDRVRGPRVARFVAFAAVVAISVSALTIRLAYLQLVQGPRLVQQTVEARGITRAIPSSRGLIYDRAGRPLVTNVPSFSVKVRPADLPFSERASVVARLSGLLGVSEADINGTIDSSPGSTFDLVRIASNVPEATARVISEERLSLPGVEVVVEAQRSYAFGPLFSQVLGYTGPVTASDLQASTGPAYLADDIIGKAGLEATYEASLRGTYGAEKVELDPAGRAIGVIDTVREPQAGASLQLTIDTREQKLAQQAIEWGIKTAGLKRGVLIVMNPQTGEVLALVSLPTYDDNQFATGISTKQYRALLDDPGQPLLNHAIAEQFPPGSTYKLVTATGGLADQRISDTTELMTKPYLEIGPYRYTEWNGRGWGPLAVREAFGHSSDTFFYQVAGMLGIDRLAYWARQFGFGAATGIDLPGEAAGVVPTNQWKLDTFGQEIFPGEVYQAGIGQGYDTVTPIQLLNAYCALANGGKLLQPQVVREVIAADGTVIRPFSPRLISRLTASPAVLRIVREAARTVVTIRHTYNLVELPINVAGKSGTAEFGLRDTQGRLPFHSWFVGFVPADAYGGSFTKPDSTLAVLALAYDSRTVGNAATEIVKYYLQLHFDIKKDYRLPQLLERGNFYGD